MANKTKEKVKLTIEVDGKTTVIETHGIAFTTLEDTGEQYKCSTGIIGNMSVKDLRELRNNVEKSLLPELLKQLPPKDRLAEMLKEMFGEDVL